MNNFQMFNPPVSSESVDTHGECLEETTEQKLMKAMNKKKMQICQYAKV
jgi:hypothetical protein